MFTVLIIAATTTVQRGLPRLTRTSDRGQATTEYALVLLGAATVALLLVAWAARSGKVGQLLDAVLDSVLDKI
jgi:hypothetical protein